MAVDVRGINTAKVGAMQSAITEWEKAVDAAKITQAAKNVTKAIKGSKAEASVKALCQACDSYANRLTDTLRAYNNRLAEVKAAYIKNDNDSTSINDVSNKIKNLKS